MHLFYERKGAMYLQGTARNVLEGNKKMHCFFIGPEKHTAKSHNMMFEEV